jgi:TolB protein
LSTQLVLAFFWSPDGRSIAFITLGRDQEDDSVIADAPQKARHVSRMAAPAQQPGRGFLTLSVINVETGQGLRLLDFEPTAAYLTQFLPFFDQYALSHRIWSPDSGALVLPVREDDHNIVLIVSAHGGRPHRLADGDIAFWSHQ